ncbi:AT-hook motif nuclear-localized protein 1-like [Cynara cardunculus var. scolymus]|uniref:AT-hook motif nuclear-localized protein n=1 Tax=Cynara cardunculus var. scolymus TaxID=59895 RepID=A0A103XEF6_CYNCS|nr:AT-hook motif nuclear-localized protein 1-like [Cynara cardunculus var. scolymus]KVH89181.1 protein of unknown function DUF296 [Cynara cardunculus var. scolymus]
MDSRENMMPAVETIAPEAPSSYQLAPRNDSSTLLTGPPGFSPLSGGGPSSLIKKKRGRPRKYGPDGVVAGGGESGRTLSPIPISASAPPASAAYSDTKFGEGEGSGSSYMVEKKKKGKMNSSETKPKHTYGSINLGDKISSGGSFTPHMVTVNPGEDVTSKIISFTKDGPRSICILSALGVISHVTLRHASSSGGTVTYEGRFEILSLSGSFTPEVEGVLSQESKMSIALSSPDGRVVGGQLGGLLTAAGPVQVVVASFLPNIGSPIEPKPKKPKTVVKLSSPPPPTTEPHATKIEQQKFNENVHDGSTAGKSGSTATRNFQLENCTSAAVHDWRRAATDMNVSLSED